MSSSNEGMIRDERNPGPRRASWRYRHERVLVKERSVPADPATGPDQALKLAEALLEGTQDAMILVRRDGTMQAVRGGSPLAQGLGLSLEEVVKDPESYLSDADMKHIEEVWHAVKAAPGALHHASFTIHDAQGHAVSVQASASNLVHTPLAAIVVRLSHERESQLPPPPTSDNVWPDDPLWQRSQFLELLQKAVKRKADRVWNAPKHVRAAMRDRRCDYAVVLLNLDRHGVLRGNFGEQELSGLMKSAAERLWKALRARDAVACLGGSELALYLDAVGDAEHAERVVDGYVRMLEDRFELDGESISLSPIVGIATSERRYERAEEVLRDAAAAGLRHRHPRRGSPPPHPRRRSA
jgi:GGDEF domain-containing protein